MTSTHSALHLGGGIGPGQAHNPPYTGEIGQGVANLGYHQGQEFRRSEFSNGNGVYVAWMTVPDPGTTGSSPDFQKGPIIPNALFPLNISGVSYRNHKVFDPYLAYFDVPPITGMGFINDGHSHFPMWIADAIDFGPVGTKIDGQYEYRISMIDASGNGWKITVEFEVSK
jgi:hypothetical protein